MASSIPTRLLRVPWPHTHTHTQTLIQVAKLVLSWLWSLDNLPTEVFQLKTSKNKTLQLVLDGIKLSIRSLSVKIEFISVQLLKEGHVTSNSDAISDYERRQDCHESD